MNAVMSSLAVVGLCAGMVAGGGLVLSGQRQAVVDPTGHWEFTYTAPPMAGGFRGTARGGRRGGGAVAAPGRGGRNTAAGRAGGRGGPGGPVAASLDLKSGPGNTVTGTIGIGVGARGAPGGNPTRPVEISDGTFAGNRLTFSAWQMDRDTNRIHVEGVLQGDRLDLTISRATPTGVDKTQVTAVRRR
jgi:hypothetical protein